MDGARPLLLLVPSGASDRDVAGAMSAARTPHLDRLAARSSLLRVRTTPPGLPAGTDVGLPTLLGVRVRRAPSRGYLDAAALGLEPLEGASAWRLDLVRRGQPWAPDDPSELAERLTDAIGAPVHPVREHRFVLMGPRSWGDGPDAPRAARPARLRSLSWRRRLRAADRVVRPATVTVWGRAAPVRWGADLDRRVVVVAGTGSPALGIASTLGVDGVAVDGGAGHALSELRSVRDVAERALQDPSGPVVVVYSHHIDDASHHGRRADKVAALGAFDAEVTGPLLVVARELHASVLWCPDHGTDPVSGRHLPDAVPAVWTPDAADTTIRHLHPLGGRTLWHAPTADGSALLRSLLRLAGTRAA